MVTSTTYSGHAKAKSYPYFDWLRLILALTVALSHDEVPMFPHAADFAVQIFFALSGWLIGGILLRSAPSDLPRFYYNRAARIWIPYFLSVGILFATSLLKEPVTAQWLEFLFYDLSYTHNWFISSRIDEVFLDLPLDGTTNHYWSISVEEQFYLAAPLLLVIAKWGRNGFLWAGLALAAWFFHQYASIAFGVFGVIVHQQFPDWHEKWPARIALGMFTIAGMAAFITHEEWYFFLAPPIALAILLLVAVEGRRSKIGEFFGGISYPLYLNHWIGIFVAHEVFQLVNMEGHPVAKLSSGLFNVAIASGFYIAVDQQIRKYRSQYFTHRRGVTFAVIAYSLVIIGGIGGLLFALAR